MYVWAGLDCFQVPCNHFTDFAYAKPPWYYVVAVFAVDMALHIRCDVDAVLQLLQRPFSFPGHELEHPCSQATNRAIPIPRPQTGPSSFPGQEWG